MPAHNPSLRSGYSITPGDTTFEPMISFFSSAGAMCVTLATAAMIARWKSGCGFSLSSTR
jgi:hypothetical protein